jgi:N-acetylmuramic acid 6-phosphate etherase
MIRITEESSLYDHLEDKTVSEILSDINTEDAKVALAVKRIIPQIEILVTGVVERMKRGGRLFYIGAGTSGRLGVLDASEIPPTFGMPQGVVVGIIAGGERALRFPVENAEDESEQGWKDLMEYNINVNDTLVGLAASGTTPYVVGALKSARENNILTACITCNPQSPMSEFSDVKMEVIVGPEYVTGSTRMKAGTAEKLILNMISTSVMISLGRVKGNKMMNLQLTNAKLVDRGVRILTDELGISYELAKNLLLINGSVKEAITAYRNRTV